MISYPIPHPDPCFTTELALLAPFSVLTPYSLASPVLSLALVPNTEQKPPLAEDEALVLTRKIKSLVCSPQRDGNWYLPFSP